VAVSDAQIEAAIARLLARRAPGASICPSDAARAVAGDGGFRPLMEPVRAVARTMAARGALEVTQRGAPVDPESARGAIRYRLPRS
jgi:uncharacterized protein DUF3253